MKKDKPKSRFEEFLAEIATRDARLKKPVSSDGSSFEPGFFSPSAESYEQPAMTPDVQLRIERLARITKSIERNLVTKPQAFPADRKFKIDYQKELNPAQFLAATTIDGPLLVIAGAGSGKTRALTYRVAYLIENGVPPQHILLLTFTRKAAAEMLARAANLCQDERCSQVVGGTFHSFANHMLRRFAGLIDLHPSFTIADTVDSEDIIDLVRREMRFDKRSRAFPRKGRLAEIISRSRNCNKPIEKVIEDEFTGLGEYAGDINLIASGYDKYKKVNHILDFDDLMEVMRDALRDNARFRQKVQSLFSYVMVDEFQDTNVVQKDIADLIAAEHRNIMVVGDDSQSIYSFRGANFENILRFPETYPGCRYVKIEQNYRSSQDILDFTNSVIAPAKIGYRKKLFSTRPRRGKPQVKYFYDREGEASYIVDRVLELREQGVSLDQVAVLYRASYHSNFIQAELLKRSIPYVVYGGIRFIERRHVKDMIAYLRIILNPLDAVSWNRILRLIPGVGRVTASRIVSHVHTNAGKIDFADYPASKFRDELNLLAQALRRAADDEVSIPAKIDILRAYYSPVLQDMEADYEIRLRDIDILHELATRYSDLEKFLSDFALDPPSNRFQDRTTPRIDESEDEPLVLSTVHSAKGLEWHSVFVPHLLDGLFPFDKSLINIEQLEEERRLFYVACTRAKEQLFLTMPTYVQSWGAFFTLPSRFLAEVDQNNYLIR